MVRRLRYVFFSGTIVLALLVLLFEAANSPANARKFALLVGVSSYPNLEKRYQLHGPDNDVRLIKSVLEKYGVRSKDIVQLYSSHDKKPTKANIVSALLALADKTGPDDFVYLYFAGHGSRQPARSWDREEEDSLDEIFLPEDVGHWEDKIAAVERAITDNEINSLISNIRRNGTFVWAVFDSCHSGTMLRSVNRIKWRKVDPGALGIPSTASVKKRTSSRSSQSGQASQGAGDGSVLPDISFDQESSSRPEGPGGYVAFYAAQSHQLAPEMKLPAESEVPKSHGMFTYLLSEAMMGGSGQTYRQLGQAILQKYVKQGMRATTPLFEGSHLDAPMFGRSNKAETHQWPILLKGSKKKRRIFVPAGQLLQVGKGAIFALLEDVSAPDEKALGYAKADFVDLFGAKLIPISYGGKPAFDPATLSRSAYARLVKPAFRFSLTVAGPRLIDGRTAREQRVAQIIESMAIDARKANTANGLRVNWVQPGQPADIHLVFSPPQGAEQKMSDCKRNRLWFLDRSGAMICSGADANLFFRLATPSIDFEQNMKKALTGWLNAIGKVRNLEQMVERFKGGWFTRRIKIKLFVTKAGAKQETEVDQASRKPLRAGDKIRLEIVNTSRDPVDLTILFVDSHYGIATLFPQRGRTNRISAKGRKDDIGGQITSDTLGLEGMIVVASKASVGAPVADFSFLSQKTLLTSKTVRSIGKPPAGERVVSAVEDMFTSAAFGRQKTRSVRSVKKSRRKPRTPFKSVAISSLRWLVKND